MRTTVAAHMAAVFVVASFVVAGCEKKEEAPPPSSGPAPTERPAPEVRPAPTPSPPDAVPAGPKATSPPPSAESPTAIEPQPRSARKPPAAANGAGEDLKSEARRKKAAKRNGGAPHEAVEPESADGGIERRLRSVDEVLDRMEWGNIAFNTPSSMNLSGRATIELLLSPSQSGGELAATITAEGEKQQAKIKISDRMEARLTGAQFQITATTPEEQVISSREATEWRWEIKPLAVGAQSLHLTLTAKFTVNGQPAQRAIRTFDKTITVRVTAGERVSSFIAQNWQWLWATLLAPAAAWLWARRRKKKKKKGK